MRELLSPREDRVFDYMWKRKGQDIPIKELWELMGGAQNAKDHPRRMQMHVGALIARLHHKISIVKIKPGEARHTYRLLRTKTKVY